MDDGGNGGKFILFMTKTIFIGVVLMILGVSMFQKMKSLINSIFNVNKQRLANNLELSTGE